MKKLDTFSSLAGRVGILGGSFDPVQFGHLHLARAAKEHHELSKVIFIPNSQNPLKNPPLASAQDRLTMLTCALQDEPQFFYSTVEIYADTPVYTVDTLSTIRSQSDAELYFLAGSDCLESLHLWKDIDTIFELVHFTVVSRSRQFSREEIDSYRETLSQKQRDTLIRYAVFCESLPVSSTEVREGITRKALKREMLPEKVADYIKKNSLYGSS